MRLKKWYSKEETGKTKFNYFKKRNIWKMKFERRNSKDKIREAKFERQNSKNKIWKMKYERQIRKTKFERRNWKDKIRKTKFKKRNSTSASRGTWKLPAVFCMVACHNVRKNTSLTSLIPIFRFLSPTGLEI